MRVFRAMRSPAVVGVVLLLLVGCWGSSLTGNNQEAFFRRHREQLDHCARLLAVHPELVQVSDGHGSLVFINHHAVLARGVPTAELGHAIDSVLAIDGVPRATLDSIQYGLVGAGMHRAIRMPSYMVFIAGGMLDNMNGFIHASDPHSLPHVGDVVESSRIIFLSETAQDWYYFQSS